MKLTEKQKEQLAKFVGLKESFIVSEHTNTSMWKIPLELRTVYGRNCSEPYDEMLTTTLPFDTDWTWIMYLFEKVEQHEYVESSEICFDDTFCVNNVMLQPSQKDTFDLISPCKKDKKESIVVACCQFVNWIFSQKIDVFTTTK